jgi:lipopolysaccharide transport system permease protein
MADASGEMTSSISQRTLGPTRFRIKLADLWSTRGVAWMIGVRDMKAKYKQAALGPLWLLIAPLGLLVALTISFSGVTAVDTAGIPYVVFALAGLTVWTFIQLSLTLATSAISGNAQLVRRSPLSRLALITGSIVGNLPPFLVMLGSTLIGAASSGRLTPKVVLLPVLVAWLFVFTFAVMLIVGSVSARFRDTVAAMPLIIQAGVFVAPVGYPLAGAPSNIATLLTLNPVTGLIEAWRWAVLDLPDTQSAPIIVAIAWTLALVVFGWNMFGRMEVEFADYV